MPTANKRPILPKHFADKNLNNYENVISKVSRKRSKIGVWYFDSNDCKVYFFNLIHQ